jgi:hypothetical protein
MIKTKGDTSMKLAHVYIGFAVLVASLLACTAAGVSAVAATSAPAAGNPTLPAAAQPPASGAVVQILSPQNGGTIQGGPLQVQYSATGGPFVETDLVVDGAPVSNVSQDGTSGSISGTVRWASPTTGRHTIVVQVLTTNKDLISASIQISVQAGIGDTPLAAQPPPPVPGTSSVQLTFVDTSDELGITKAAVITVKIRYTLSAGTGFVEARLDMSTDGNCTTAFYDATGTSHAATVQANVSAGSGEVTLQLPAANVTSPYAGIAVGLFNPAFLAGDNGRVYCYAVIP